MTTNPSRIPREARLQWVPLGKLQVCPNYQRGLNRSRVNAIAANLDVEQVGFLTVSERDGTFWIIDGQHRCAALRESGFGDEQQVQCRAYAGLSEEDEAEMFLKLNDAMPVRLRDKFRAAVEAGRLIECDVDRTVRANGLAVTNNRDDGITGVGSLLKVYALGGAGLLGRTLRIIRDAYGLAGFDASVIEGVGLVCHRYGAQLDDTAAAKKLSALLGGVNGLTNNAEKLRKQMGASRAQCAAAAVVDVVNGGRRGGTKLVPWWRAE